MNPINIHPLYTICFSSIYPSLNIFQQSRAQFHIGKAPVRAGMSYILHNYSYCTRTHTIYFYVHTFYDMLFGTGSTRPSWYYIFILLGIFGRQACVSCVSSLRLHGALVALAFTVFHYHFFPQMPTLLPTLLHKDVTNHECNWRTVMHQLFLRCGWLFIEATSHSNAYFFTHLRRYCQMLPQEVMT